MAIVVHARARISERIVKPTQKGYAYNSELTTVASMDEPCVVRGKLNNRSIYTLS